MTLMAVWNQNATVPNFITLSRLLLLPPTLWLLAQELLWSAAPLLAWLYLSDFLDGRLARHLNQQTYLGTLLDPIADKCVAMSLFVFLWTAGVAPGWYVALVITRDIAQLLSIPVLLLWQKIQFKVRPAPIAKWGTALNFALQGVFFLELLLGSSSFASVWLHGLQWPLLAISGLIEAYILVTYVPRFVAIWRGTHDTFE
jgi:cardiolipin synthase